MSSFSHTEDSYSYQRFECIYMGNIAVPEAFGVCVCVRACVCVCVCVCVWCVCVCACVHHSRAHLPCPHTVHSPCPPVPPTCPLSAPPPHPPCLSTCPVLLCTYPPVPLCPPVPPLPPPPPLTCPVLLPIPQSPHLRVYVTSSKLQLPPRPPTTPPPGMHMVNDALVQLSQGKARWMAIYLDISPQCIKLVDKDVSDSGVVDSPYSLQWV